MKVGQDFFDTQRELMFHTEYVLSSGRESCTSVYFQLFMGSPAFSAHFLIVKSIFLKLYLKKKTQNEVFLSTCVDFYYRYAIIYINMK